MVANIMPWTFSEKCGYIEHYGGLCLHPLGGSSDPEAGTEIVLYTGCRETRLYFCATPDHEIKHKSSGLCIAPKAGSLNPEDNVELVLNQCGFSANKFIFTEGWFQFSFVTKYIIAIKCHNFNCHSSYSDTICMAAAARQLQRRWCLQ